LENIIFNETNEDIEELEVVEDLIRFAMKKMKLKDVLFNIIIVDNKRIRELNKVYRSKDTETDVITFALEDENTVLSPKVRVLGDIYISIDKARSQADSYGHSLKRELSFLAVHGFLHLLQYDHMDKDEEKIMFDLQEEILNEYGIKR
jgi:probable rRNA maturation factor